MNRDHIIKLAREARLIKDWMVLCEQDSDALTKFAALVAAAERERKPRRNVTYVCPVCWASLERQE